MVNFILGLVVGSVIGLLVGIVLGVVGVFGVALWAIYRDKQKQGEQDAEEVSDDE